jgi:hypothetical protein
MLDAQPLRRTLSEPGAELALIVSEKRITVHGWIYLPDGWRP